MANSAHRIFKLQQISSKQTIKHKWPNNWPKRNAIETFNDLELQNKYKFNSLYPE